jgi:hypothetical protein
MGTSQEEREKRLAKRRKVNEREERRRDARRGKGKHNPNSARNGATARSAPEAGAEDSEKSIRSAPEESAPEAVVEKSAPEVVEEAGVDGGFVLIRANSSTQPLSPSVEGDYDNLGDCEWQLDGLGDFVVINGDGIPMASVSLPTAHPVVDAESLKEVATTSSTAPLDKGQERGIGS